MSQPNAITAYLDELARELAFDPALSRRVRHEVHDHLCEAADAERGETAADAEQRAIARFGRPREIAAPYKAIAAYGRIRRAGTIVVLAVAGIFLAMEGRVVWYGLVQWPVSDELQALGAGLLPIDRSAFLSAALLAILGWLTGLGLSIPADARLMSRARLRGCQRLGAAATVAVTVAVALELLLTGLRLRESGLAWSAFLPIASLALELGLVASVAIYLRNTRRRLDRCIADP
jgi:HAAS domain-containing protein